jgi:hypothetical protein
MANYYTDQLQNPASTSIEQMEKTTPTTTGISSIISGGYRPPQNLSAPWSKELDNKYDTNLMAEEGIERTSGTSIVNNIAGQYADAVRTNAPVVQRNANVRADAMQGLLGQAKGQDAPMQAQPSERAQIRQRRQSSQRQQRYQVGD